jgi:L-lactate dehydrogenase complex protein LldF
MMGNCAAISAPPWTRLGLRRRTLFSDPEAFEQLRARGDAIRQRALNKLPELLEQLERKCIENGIQVHWAETPAEANQICLDIIQRHHATRVIKGKSMVSEEMHLNHFLEERGIEALETDLGEYIIQLDHETPSHIIVPAIHKNRDQIAKLFHDKIPNTPYTEVVEELNAIARKVLREKFFAGEVGVSGVNFAVAETGTLCLVENEGNGRMCTTAPPVHIAVMGLEKVLEKLEDVPPLLRLLTGSATGQLITTYFNMISSPRKPGEKDGPKEVHLVLLDNGRSKIWADPELRQTLKCIRCGACLNHCPVYTRLGGHAYGYVYPGPIGSILTPQLEGSGSRRRDGDRLHLLRGLRGSLSGQDSDHRHPASPAHRVLQQDGFGERRQGSRLQSQHDGEPDLERLGAEQRDALGQCPERQAAGLAGSAIAQVVGAGHREKMDPIQGIAHLR